MLVHSPLSCWYLTNWNHDQRELTSSKEFLFFEKTTHRVESVHQSMRAAMQHRSICTDAYLYVCLWMIERELLIVALVCV
jgi:hypothetical protein